MRTFVLVCGVDDAGRGSLLGPLVIAGVSIERSKIRKLSSLGVKDSKKLSPKNREILYAKILELADNYHIVKILPKTIDKSVLYHNLNNLEAKYMAKVVSKLSANISYVDSCDVNPKRFGHEVSRLANHNNVKSYHHADSRFVVVSAASILAKVTRDRAIARLRKKYDVGSGYPSDSKSIDFVKNYLQEHDNVPQFVRKSWKPVQIIVNTN